MKRRTLLAMMGAGFTHSAWANPQGFLPDPPKKLHFQNGVLLDKNGVLHQNIGLRITEEGAVFSSSIKEGFDLKGAWMVPGFVDAGNHLGLYEVGLENGTHDDRIGSAEHRELLSPIDGYNPLSRTVPLVRNHGITHCFLHPKINDLVVGQMSAIRTAGLLPREALLQENIGLLVTLGNRAKTGGRQSRIEIAYDIRKKLSAQGKREGKRKSFFDRKKTDPYAGLEDHEKIWAQIANKELPILFHAHRVDDIDLVCQLTKEYDIRSLIVGGGESWMIADRLAEQEIGMLYGPIDIQPSRFEHLKARTDTPTLLHQAGVTFAFRTGDNHRVSQLPSLAGLSVAHGLPFEEAIKAITVNAYDLLGMNNHNAITLDAEPQQSSFFLCTGDPLQPRNEVLRMWIEGKEVSLDTEQKNLYERFRDLSER